MDSQALTYAADWQRMGYTRNRAIYAFILLVLAKLKSLYVLQTMQSPEVKVTKIILTKVQDICQMASNFGFLSHICLYLNLCFFLCFLKCLLLKHFIELWKILMKIQTCQWIIKISTANPKSNTFVKCLWLPKRNLGLSERKTIG
jgi:hypothetical protein